MEAAVERMQHWIARAHASLAEGDMDGARAAANEAGRLGIETPAVFAEHPDLVDAYRRGHREALTEAEALVRFNALADVFSDACPAT